MKKLISLALLLFVCFSLALHAEPGDDVRQVFARTNRGEPLRCVFMGGSITQAGDGWVGDWLRRQFPQSQVMVVNSGMSATGSALGVFRLERDVLAYQPNFVALEYCVNDGGVADEEVIRNMESIIVRLKSQPRPPAIVILEAAAQGGVNLARHRRVARHYGLLEVDFQQAVDERLKERAELWQTYFKDRVHPNAAGNAFYAEVLEAALAPYAKPSLKPVPHKALPAPLSAKPLLLDARMVPLACFAAAGRANPLCRLGGTAFSLGC